MAIGYILLLLFGGYVALKYYAISVQVEKKTKNNLVAPPGVNYYCCSPVPSRPQQVWAFAPNNCCSTVESGFAPSLGPNENQPEPVINLEI